MEPELHQEMGDVADVTNSNAFLSIDSLLEEGKLVEERAAHLKSKFKELHDRVLQIYNHDNFLLKRARQYRKELETQKAAVERCGRVARDDDETIQQLKKELAAAEHELSVAQEKESMLQVEALELDRKKQQLTHEIEDAIAAEERRLKPQIEGLHKDIRDIGDQIDATSKSFDAKRELREGLLAKEQQLREAIEKTNNVIYEAKLEFTRVEKEPERAKKQAEIVVKAHASAEKQLSSYQEQLAQQLKELAQLAERKKQLNDQQCDLVATLTTNETEITSKKASIVDLNKHLSYEMENRSALQARVADNETLEHEASVEFNRVRDELNRMLRNKDAGMKEFKRIEQAKADLQSETEIYRKQMEILKREQHRLSEQRRAAATELEELKRDVDILINSFLKEEIAERRCVKDKESLHGEIRGLEDQVAARAQLEQEQKRTLSDLAVKREQCSRECSRNQGRVMLARNELKVKEVIVRELKKRHDELSARLNALMEMFQNVKRERSNKAAQIQSASQRMSETQEKIKILENELEVLRRESLIKDQELARKRREAHELSQTCKNLQVDKSKQRKRLDAAGDTEKDLKNQMKKLNSIITHTEDEMLDLKKAYEDAVENRNFTGIQLIDRNDELCILYEKSNIQETILRQGMVVLNHRNDEIRALAVKMRDLQRQIELCQKVLPQVRDMEEDLAQLLQDLQEERWRAQLLEEDLTDPANQERWRKVRSSTVGGDGASSPGASASPSAGDVSGGGGGSGSAPHEGPSAEHIRLEKKQQELEQRVATVNERLLEKDLVLEEVTDLSNRLRKQALNGREFTVALAKKVNNYQFGIKSKTKRMMATLSELSMVQASSIKMQMDVQRLEEEVSNASVRMEQGLPPTDAAAHLYEREQLARSRRAELQAERKQREAALESQALRTTAEARPNAYIPDGDLGLPKPYGAHAPFKPNLAAQLTISKYYRKSAVKDIDFEEDD